MTVSQLVIRLRNPLPWEDSEAQSLVKFKEALDNLYEITRIPRQVIINYDENSGKDIRCCALGIMLVSIRMR